MRARRLRWRRGTGLAAAVAAILFALMLLFAPGASAHAVVVSSTPADGSRLAAAPSTVTVKFDESVGLSLGYLKVVDSSGRTVSDGTAAHPGGDGTSVRVALKTGLGDGTYLASFRVISADSHPIGGSIRFVVGNGALGAVTASATATPHDVSVGLAVAHWLGFAGIAVVGGSWVVFALWTGGRRRPSVRRLLWTGWAVAVLGAVGEFVVQGPYDAGTSLTTVSSTLLDATAHSGTGQLLSVRLILLGVVGFALNSLLTRGRRSSWGAEAAAIVGVGVVVTFAASGHTQSASPRWFAVLVDAGHLSAMIVWLGGLVVLVTAALAQHRAEVRFAALAAEGADGAGVAELEAARTELSLVEYAALSSVGRRVEDSALDDAHASAVLEQLDFDRSDLEEADYDRSGYDGSGYDGDEHETDYEDSGYEASEYEDGDFDDGHEVDPGDPLADAEELAAGLPIFSRVALICIIVLAVTGTIQAWREVGPLAALTATTYGKLVITKVVLFFSIVALGWLARRVLSRFSGRTALQVLRRTLVTEVLVGATVLGVTAVLISQPPGSVALSAQHSKAVSTTVRLSATATAVVEINPGKHGDVQVDVDVVGAKPVDVTATAGLPSKDLGPIPVALQAIGPASYSASSVSLPSAGDWQINLVVKTSEFDATTVTATLHLY